MNTIDFNKRKKRIDWKANKAYSNVKKTVEPYIGILELTGEETVSLKLMLEMFLEDNESKKAVDYALKGFITNLQTVLNKINKEMELYEKDN